ncbi:hypothetical protein [Zhihengliuella sp.]|uniref:hypothetical protein n=1 Tax=Zhihengliuella sp. TaxID=1954483 RepID=UPI0028110D8F|nr:hypothetical protein [Zhihengliuella sp.]
MVGSTEREAEFESIADQAPARAVVAVDVDGAQAWWNGDDFEGDTVIVEDARRSAAARLLVDLAGQQVLAGANNPLGAAAALAHYDADRTAFTRLNSRIADWLYQR